MKTITTSILAALLVASCATNKREVNHSFFGGKQGELGEPSEPVAPQAAGPSEREIDTGFGVALTPPKGWGASEPDPDQGIVITSVSNSVVRLHAYQDSGAQLDHVTKWHEDYSKLAANVIEPLAEAELAGSKAWTAKYHLMVDEETVSHTMWELPHNKTFYRVHVIVADASDRYETQTVLDSLRFVPASNAGSLPQEIPSASIDNSSPGKSKLSVAGWDKAPTCPTPGCVGSWARGQSVILLFRRDFASEAAAKRDLPLLVAMQARVIDGTSRAAKYGKNAGELIKSDTEWTWLHRLEKSIWTVKLMGTADEMKSFEKAFEKSLTSARFK